jgi:hypothetical protein
VKRYTVLRSALVCCGAAALMLPGASAHANTDQDVGVVPSSASCPTGSESLTIHMDDEDFFNRNSRGGSIGATRSGRNTDFFFCRVNGAAFHAYRPRGSDVRPYAVLKLGQLCPNGSTEFRRRFDNEDLRNANSSRGNIFPNVSDSNTTLVFCLFGPGSGSSSRRFPNLGYGYHVFSSVDSTGWIRTDDEDHNNANSYTVPEGIRDIAQAMVSSGANTVLRFRVAG